MLSFDMMEMKFLYTITIHGGGGTIMKVKRIVANIHTTNIEAAKSFYHKEAH